MKKAFVLLVVCLMLFGTMLPSPAWADGRWHGGHRGGHGGWWLPAAAPSYPHLLAPMQAILDGVLLLEATRQRVQPGQREAVRE